MKVMDNRAWERLLPRRRLAYGVLAPRRHHRREKTPSLRNSLYSLAVEGDLYGRMPLQKDRKIGRDDRI